MRRKAVIENLLNIILINNLIIFNFLARFIRYMPDKRTLTGKDNNDAKLSLAGLLLTRKLVHERLHVPYSAVHIERTKERKTHFKHVRLVIDYIGNNTVLISANYSRATSTSMCRTIISSSCSQRTVTCSSEWTSWMWNCRALQVCYHIWQSKAS